MRSPGPGYGWTNGDLCEVLSVLATSNFGIFNEMCFILFCRPRGRERAPLLLLYAKGAKSFHWKFHLLISSSLCIQLSLSDRRPLFHTNDEIRVKWAYRSSLVTLCAIPRMLNQHFFISYPTYWHTVHCTYQSFCLIFRLPSYSAPIRGVLATSWRPPWSSR